MGSTQSAVEFCETQCHVRSGTVFADPLSLTIPDPEHSRREPRFVTIGRALDGKLLVVVHTDRGDNIRIIRARGASRRERKDYEED